MKRVLLSMVLAAAPAVAAPIAITGATAHTARGEEIIRNATIIIDNGAFGVEIVRVARPVLN